MKYLYEANRDFEATHRWGLDSEREIKDAIELAYQGETDQREAQREQIVVAVGYFLTSMVLAFALFLALIGLRPAGHTGTAAEYLSDLGVSGVLFCVLPILFVIGVGIFRLFHAFSDYMPEVVQYHYNDLRRWQIPTTGRVNAVVTLNSDLRRISFVYTYTSINRRLRREILRQGYFITASSTDLKNGDVVFVIANDKVEVLL